MRGLRWLVPLALVAVLAASACGDDGDDASTGDPEGDEPSGSGWAEYPTGADDVVIEIASEGGFAGPSAMPPPPSLLVLGEGRLVQPGVTTMQYPGALVPPLQERSISEDGIAQLLALADEHGLLAERTYDAPDNVMDAPDTVVTVTAGGQTYEHRAYALGIGTGDDGGEIDPARADLQAFVEAASTFASSQDSALGTEAPFAADAYLVRAVPDDGTPTPDGIEPSTAEWPADAPVRLADAGECAEVPAEAVAGAFADADELTRFVDGGVAYAVSVVPRLPGQSCA